MLRQHAPWLLEPRLGVCVVGSGALARACESAGIEGPTVGDLDLAWGLSVDEGDALLTEKGVGRPTTVANRSRGTLALMLDGERIEVTTFRSSTDGPIEERITADLAERDMTVGAIAWWLAEDRILDPQDGLRHWREHRIVPCGDAAARIGEHPIRWLRYYRRACEWGFSVDPSIHSVKVDRGIVENLPAEAIAGELRAALLRCPSPGRFLLELDEVGLLNRIAPELAPQFDGRPAGPVRYHPEVSQGLHVILCLEWIAKRTRGLPEQDRLAAVFAVLCHDLGKGLTPAAKLPSHPGHEGAGVDLIRQLTKRLPSLVDRTAARLAEHVARLHLEVRNFARLRPGTLAGLYDRYFRHADFRVDLFALAVGADVGGRLGCEDRGDETTRDVQRDITWLQEACGGVDAAALRSRFAQDDEGFRRALHEARCAAIRAAR